MKKGNKYSTIDDTAALKTLEAEFGEPILYRATGRILGQGGLDGVPLDDWGLLVLTPTRLVFRRFAQAHPLLGGRGEEVNWQVLRERFASCQPVLQSFWNKVFSGTPDHIALAGPDAHLALETADDLSKLPAAWNHGPTP